MFSDELYVFFQYLGRKILSEVNLKNPLESVFYGYAADTINKYWVEYDKILSHYVDKAAIIGYAHYEILLNASKDRAKKFQATKAKNNPRQFLDNELATSDNNELFAPNPRVADGLERYKFMASEKTKSRVNNEISQILAEGYKEGWGPRHVAQKIQQRFTDLSSYESRRIAQTEINTTRNFVQYNQLVDDGIEYKIWHAAHDSRTRKSHLDVDEEIVPINEPFSNGLMYPGDKSGPVSEWVNCRCSHAAFIMPLGYQAPDFWPFTEADLVKVGSSLSQDYVSQIRERLSVLNGVVVSQAREQKIEKPDPAEPVITQQPKTETTAVTNLTKQEAERLQKAQKQRDQAKTNLSMLAADDPRRIKHEYRLKSAEKTIAKLEEIAANPEARVVTTETVLKKGAKSKSKPTLTEVRTYEEVADYFGWTLVEEETVRYGKTQSKRLMMKDEKYGTTFLGLEDYDFKEAKEVMKIYTEAHPFLKKAPDRIYLRPETELPGRAAGTYAYMGNTIDIASIRNLPDGYAYDVLHHEMVHAFDYEAYNVIGKSFSENSKQYKKIIRKEGYSTRYSNSTNRKKVVEDFAESGMLVLNKNNPKVRIQMPDGTWITAKEWCKQFPEKVEFFERLLETPEMKKIFSVRD